MEPDAHADFVPPIVATVLNRYGLYIGFPAVETDGDGHCLVYPVVDRRSGDELDSFKSVELFLASLFPGVLRWIAMGLRTSADGETSPTGPIARRLLRRGIDLARFESISSRLLEDDHSLPPDDLRFASDD